jgi:hypothetical protein
LSYTSSFAVGNRLRIIDRHARMSFAFAGSNFAMNDATCVAADAVAIHPPGNRSSP